MRRETAYLRDRNAQAAQRFSATVRLALQRLAAYERLGSGADELPVPGLRRLVVGDYVLFYEIAGEEVLVLAARHGRQAPFDAFDEDFDYETDLD